MTSEEKKISKSKNLKKFSFKKNFFFFSQKCENNKLENLKATIQLFLIKSIFVSFFHACVDIKKV
ncbi:hypothetical protein BpHYR1_021284 [Brachionus plicatilis]|uniref:Uncharacterized protein n=1 Tax=Brachionus plicatilis TaxID=10195 RepID=A0A3M7PJD6_BRAPC|nr:hypothetical protein BpHYR1_021284 [Brachionus plicatilis]